VTRATLERDVAGGESLLLDASTLIAYLEGNERTSPIASEILDMYVAPGRNSAIVSMVTVMEVLVKPLRQTVPGPFRHTLDLLQHFPNLRLTEIDLPVAQEAASLRAYFYLSPPDALVIATGVIAQVKYLVTNDRQWKTRFGLGAKEPELRMRRFEVRLLEDYLPFP
jgi:predicted nucleic acid-binding protein